MQNKLIDKTAKQIPKLVVRLEILGEVIQNPMAQGNEGSYTYYPSRIIGL